MFGLESLIEDATSSGVDAVTGAKAHIAAAINGALNWPMLIDAARQALSLTEREYAAYLQISHTSLGQCRKNREALPIAGRIRVIRALGIELSHEMLIKILPSTVQAVILEGSDASTPEKALAELDDFFDKLDHDPEMTRRFVERLAGVLKQDVGDFVRSLGGSRQTPACSWPCTLTFGQKRALFRRVSLPTVLKASRAV